MEAKHPDYDRHYEEWKRTLPNASHEVLHDKVTKHIAFKEQVRAATYHQDAPAMPPSLPVASPMPMPVVPDIHFPILELRIIAGILLLILLGLAIKGAHGEPAPPLPIPYTRVMMLPQAGTVPIPLPVQGSGSSSPVYVICSSGCSAAGAFADNSAFTVGTTPGSILFGYYTSGSAPTLTSGSAARARMDSSSYLFVDCAVGCAGGSFNNNSDGVATSSTNGQSAAWLYGFNGTTWDRLRDDSNKYLYVDVANSSLAVTGTFWQATQPVSGTFWQTTQPISAASLPLPTGASTAAKQPALGTAGSASADVITVQGIASMTPLAVTLATAPTTAVTIADGASVTLGAKADAKNAATDTTAITIMQVLKEISSLEQAPASRAVTNAGTFATQSAITAASGSIASGAIASGAIASGACVSGCIADGGVVTLGAKADAKSAATDTTAITAMQVLKEISYMLQNPASLPTNQSTNVAQIGATAVVANPCQQAVPTTVAISQTANTKIISAASSKHNYICSIIVIAGAAEIPSIVEGTGSTCGTSTAAVAGSTTTANGMSLAANGGFTMGNGQAAVIPGIGTNVDTCLFQNGSNRLAGMISYVQE